MTNLLRTRRIGKSCAVAVLAAGAAVGTSFLGGAASAAPITAGDVTVDGGNAFFGDNEVITDPHPEVYFPNSRLWVFTDDFTHAEAGDLHVDVYPDGEIAFPPSTF